VFALLGLAAVVVGLATWFVYQFTLMVYTPCGGAGTCADGAQRAIAIGFLGASALSVLVPWIVGVVRRGSGRSYWWLPLVSIVSVLVVLVVSWPLNVWAAA